MRKSAETLPGNLRLRDVGETVWVSESGGGGFDWDVMMLVEKDSFKTAGKPTAILVVNSCGGGLLQGRSFYRLREEHQHR